MQWQANTAAASATLSSSQTRGGRGDAWEATRPGFSSGFVHESRLVQAGEAGTSVVGSMTPVSPGLTGLVLDAPATVLSSGGERVHWTLSPDGRSVHGATASRAVLDVALDSDSRWHATLSAPVDHTDGADVRRLDFTVSGHDTQGRRLAAATVQVRVSDDNPSVDSCRIQTLPPPMPEANNVMIMLDVSASMSSYAVERRFDDASQTWRTTGSTRLAIAARELETLLDRYQAAGETRVRLLVFNEGATTELGGLGDPGWTTVDALRVYLQGLDGRARGLTYYQNAVDTAVTVFETPGALSGPGVSNTIFFITDGEPNPGREIGAAQQMRWEDFLHRSRVRSFAIGIGDELKDMRFLEPLAYDGTDGHELPAVHVRELEALDTVLAASGPGPDAHGSFGRFGADGGYVTRVEFNGEAFAIDPERGVLPSARGNASYHFDAPNHTLRIQGTSGLFVADLDDARYVFLPQPGFAAPSRVRYTVTDADGDARRGDILFVPPPTQAAFHNLELADTAVSQDVLQRLAGEGGTYF